MKTNKFIFIILLCSLLISACSAQQQNQLQQLPTTQVTIHNQPITVWLATTTAQHQKGLMFVTAEQLGNRGMLFVFQHSQKLSFWMENTWIPLDIAFLDANANVVRMYTMKTNTTDLYPSIIPARYALELPAGTLHKLKVKIGDRFKLHFNRVNL